MRIVYDNAEHAKIFVGRGCCDGYCIPTSSASLIFVVTPHGLVGCGFFAMDTFAKMGMAGAKVAGVSTLEELLAGKVSAVSPAAEQMGVAAGMTGEEAVLRMMQAN